MSERYKPTTHTSNDENTCLRTVDYGPKGFKVVRRLNHSLEIWRTYGHSINSGMGPTEYGPSGYYLVHARKTIDVHREGAAVATIGAPGRAWNTAIERLRNCALAITAPADSRQSGPNRTPKPAG